MGRLEKTVCILFGNFCVALATVYFIVPAGFISGGATGLALVMEEYWGIPISWGLAALSVLLLWLGWLVLGREFLINSTLSALSFPAFVWILEQVIRYIPFTTDSVALNLAASVLLLGYGIALIMRFGASSGGLDAIAMILYKKRGVSLSLSVNVLEILCMLPQLSYSSPTEILGGVLLTVLYTAVMNRFLSEGVARVQVMIYSDQYEAINTYVDTQLRRGSTLFRVQGGYRRQDTFALQTVISNRELFQLKERVLQIDPTAFMTVSEISEVSGKGFTIRSDVPGDNRRDIHSS